MRTPEGEWRKLKQLERKAKKQKIGGWGIGAGRLHLRATAQTSQRRPTRSLGPVFLYSSWTIGVSRS